MPPVVSIEGISKSIGPKSILRDVSLAVHEGEVITIIGPSGSGKTTLIRNVNALQDIDSGKILLDGQSWVSNRGNRYQLSQDFHQRIVELGMVFQNFNLFPHRSVLENVMLAPIYHRCGSRSIIREKALAALAKVEMQALFLADTHLNPGAKV